MNLHFPISPSLCSGPRVLLFIKTVPEGLGLEIEQQNQNGLLF